MQVKEEPRIGRHRTRSETIAIPCEACEETFDSKQMKNDHFLLAHAQQPTAATDEITAEKENSTPKASRKRPAATPDIIGGAVNSKKAPTTDPGPNSRSAANAQQEKPGKEYRGDIKLRKIWLQF